MKGRMNETERQKEIEGDKGRMREKNKGKLKETK